MHATDDDSIPVPHDAFRMPRGLLKWKKPYLIALLIVGGLYALLVVARRVTPVLLTGAAASTTQSRDLPLLAQFACALAGLAALVFVLSRAVRQVDKRPYVAIAPVFAAFAGLVHAGVHAPLPVFGAVSALVPYPALAVALLGGAFVLRDDARSQRLGWGLVVAPTLLIFSVICMAKGEFAITPAERGWLTGLLLSSAVLGAAGVVSRSLRSSAPAREPAQPEPPALLWSDDLADVPTSVAPAPRAPARRFDTVRTMAPRLPAHWHASRLQIAVGACSVALLTYASVRGMRHDAAAPRAAAHSASDAPAPAPVIEQLSRSGKAHAATPTESTRRDTHDKPKLGHVSTPARNPMAPAYGADRRSAEARPSNASSRARAQLAAPTSRPRPAARRACPRGESWRLGLRPARPRSQRQWCRRRPR